MRLIQVLTAVLTGMLLTLAVAQAQDDVEAAEPAKQEEKAPPPPSFKPGAQVNLALTLKAPRGWNLNYMVPLRFEFDKEYLKDAPIKVKQQTWDFNIESYLPEATFVIPVTLKKGLKDGDLSIPLPIICSICESSGEMCTFCMENMTIKLVVKAEPAEGDGKHQAQDKGTLESTHRLSLP